MKNKLIALQSNLCKISVKGGDVMTMAACLQFTEEMIRECDMPVPEGHAPEETEASPEEK